MILSVLGILVALAAWGAVHSWLASLGVKDAVRRRFGQNASNAYRLLYNIFSVVTFVPILLLVGMLPDRILYLVQPPLEYVMLLGQLLGVLGLLLALKQTDALGLVGLKQLLGQQESDELVTGGLYRYMRHPMYFFGLVIIWLTPVMTVNVLTACVGLTAYLFVGAYYEEKKLARLFGSTYEAYRSVTPMMIPFWVPRRRPA
jgi:methanethiol S-methyltransferase